MIKKTNRVPRAKKLAKSKYTKKQISEAIQKWTRVLESMTFDDSEFEPDFIAAGKYSSFDVSQCHPLAVAVISGVAPMNGGDETCIICPYEDVPSQVARFICDLHEDSDFANAVERQKFINELNENTESLINLVMDSHEGEKQVYYKMKFTTTDQFIVTVNKMLIPDEVSEMRIALNG